MAIVRRTKTEDYIVVHHVYGEQAVIDFLRMTSRKIIARLFFDARNNGSSEFTYRSSPYKITYSNKDLYEIDKVEDDVRDVY